jgi:hypothetical protein
VSALNDTKVINVNRKITAKSLHIKKIIEHKVCLNSKFPTLHSTLEIHPATLFGEKCLRLYWVIQNDCE